MFLNRVNQAHRIQLVLNHQIRLNKSVQMVFLNQVQSDLMIFLQRIPCCDFHRIFIRKVKLNINFVLVCDYDNSAFDGGIHCLRIGSILAQFARNRRATSAPGAGSSAQLRSSWS